MDPSQDLFLLLRLCPAAAVRFAELYRQVKFPQALGLLRQWRGWAFLLREAVSSYRLELHRQAVAYLLQTRIPLAGVDGAHAHRLRTGCLRAWLTQLGYHCRLCVKPGLVTRLGYDTYIQRIVIALEDNLYGRSQDF